MRFGTLVWKNVSRRPLRSSLTVFAVAIAIGAVVALTGIAAGFRHSFVGIYESVGVDLVVVRAGLSQPLTSALGEKLRGRIKAIPGVKRVIPALVDVLSFEDLDLYGVPIQGLVPDPIPFQHFHLRAGRHLNEHDGKALMLGSIVAANLGKNVHDFVKLFDNEEFEVVGIFENPNVFENGSIIVPLEQLQRIMDRPNQVTGFSVILESTPQGKPIDQVRHAIEQLGNGLQVMPVREHVDSMTPLRMAHAMAWLTSALALLIGTTGVLNTMVMSVHERTHEIGILRAVGWGRGLVVGMVFSESLTLSLMGACLGTLGAVALVRLSTRLPMINGLVDGHVPLDVIGQGLAIALLVGLMGGSVSAFRAAQLLPTVALRHE